MPRQMRYSHKKNFSIFWNLFRFFELCQIIFLTLQILSLLLSNFLSKVTFTLWVWNKSIHIRDKSLWSLEEISQILRSSGPTSLTRVFAPLRCFRKFNCSSAKALSAWFIKLVRSYQLYNFSYTFGLLQSFLLYQGKCNTEIKLALLQAICVNQDKKEFFLDHFLHYSNISNQKKLTESKLLFHSLIF